MVIWHEIFAQRRSPSSQMKKAAHSVHARFSYCIQMETTCFYKVMQNTFSGCCYCRCMSGGLWIYIYTFVWVFTFFFAPPLCQVCFIIPFTCKLRFPSAFIYFMYSQKFGTRSFSTIILINNFSGQYILPLPLRRPAAAIVPSFIKSSVIWWK